MSWQASVRLAGWRGGRLPALEVAAIAGALESGLRGRRRRAVAQTLLDAWRSELDGRTELSLQQLALMLRLVEPEGDVAAHPWCSVDIELGPDGSITEIGVALRHPVNGRVLAGSGLPKDIDALNDIVANRWVLAHNGAAHDFPILTQHGASLPDVCIDSLPWSWLAWPTAPSHALAALWEAATGTRMDTTTLHRAAPDARVLLDVWGFIVDELGPLDDSTRSELVRSLAGVEPQIVVQAVLRTPEATWEPPQDVWEELGGADHRPSSVVSETHYDASAAAGSVLVTRRLQELYRSHDDLGMYLASWMVLDPSRVQAAPASWARSLAVRLLETTRGAIPLGPPSACDMLAPLARTGPPLSLPAERIATNPLTVTLHPPPRHLTYLGGLTDLLRPVDTGVTVGTDEVSASESVSFAELGSDDRARICARLAAASPSTELAEAANSASGSLVRDENSWRWMLPTPDPKEHAAGVTIVTRSPVGGARSSVLWHSLLGPATDIIGPDLSPQPWTLLEGMPVGGRRFPGRRAAVMLSLAAARQRTGRSVVVVDAGIGRDAVARVAGGLWRQHTAGPLLRPPLWPTFDEAIRRLRTPHTAIVATSSAQLLGRFADDMLVTQPVTPPVGAPLVQRLLEDAERETLRAGVGDPFADIVEPMSAHLTCEVVAAAPGTQVVIGGPIDGAGLLSELIGRPTVETLDRVDRDTKLYDALSDALTSSTTRRLNLDSGLSRACSRLLSPGNELKDFQRSVIADVLDGTDVLAVFRTGLGKSLCYQVPALCLAESDATTLVISPLLALQRDQVDSLRRRGVREVAMYNSGVAPEVRRAIRRGLLAGYYRVVYAAPEALWNRPFVEALSSLDVGLIAIDEAHCISEMGHDFRPDYRTIPMSIKRMLGLTHDARLPASGKRPIVLALTGTAAPAVRDDIQAALS